MRTVLLFALPEEYTNFKRVTGPWHLAHRTPFKTFLHATPFHEIVLVETGMGQKQLLEALPWLLESTCPDLIISAGFAGSLSEDLAVGDVGLGEDFSSLDEGHHVQPCSEIVGASLQKAGSCGWERAAGDRKGKPSVTFHLETGAETVSRLMRVGGQYRLHSARIVTVNQPQPKLLLANKFADSVSIMDMESYAAARFCHEHGIPFLGLRTVSDGLWDEIDFDPIFICDGRGHVSIPLVLLSVMRSPRLIKSYYRSWKRSRTAARSLGSVLAGLLALPAGELGALAKSISYTRR